MLKNFAKSDLAAKIVAGLAGFYIRLVHATSRWRLIDREYYDIERAKGKGVILAFWHGRLMLAPAIRKETDARIFMLISAHLDGDIIADAVKSFDLDFIRGSAANPKKSDKNKSGAAATAQMHAALKAGDIVGFTPDGPRGPRERVKPGLIKLAQISGAPIVPLGLSASRGKIFKSWDRFLLASPFSSGFAVVGAPIQVASDIDNDAIEALRITVENSLRDMTKRANEMAGRDSKPDGAGELAQN